MTAFPDRELLAWTDGTVGSFRSFQYGGPAPHIPLAHAFPGAPDAEQGAWCGIRQTSDSIAWWAVVEGSEPARAIIITGPGEGGYRGQVDRPPIVP